MSKVKLGKKNIGRSACGEENHAARKWYLRSPDNVVYVFKNLREFVRSNPHLFPEDAVIWKKAAKKPNNSLLTCKALGGLLRLNPARKKTLGSWRGWTWNSATEVFYNQQQDLLNR